MATELPGTSGNDIINGTDLDEHITGLAGNDIIHGNGGNDVIEGGTGNDTISGGTGTDTLSGGTGADIFVDSAANLNGDTITDMLPGDRLWITDTTLNQSNINIQFTGNVMSFNGGSVTLSNLGPGRFVTRSITGGGVEIRLQQDAHNDFNGDGRSDVLWLSDAGNVRDWLGQDHGAFAGNVANLNAMVDPNVWHLAGAGDFNGDGRVDILWRSGDGTVTEWTGQANGGFAPTAVNTAVPTDWHIVGTGDFNGDGLSDILWRSDQGTVRDWLGQADGTFTGNVANLNTTVPTDWQIVGTGDFNGDGITDVLWRSNDGTVRDWLGQSNGAFVGNVARVNTTVPNDWHIVGTGDFNGDGRDDILWRSDGGTIREWLAQSDDSFAGNTANLNWNLSGDWHVAAIGDYNGDAIDDLLLQNHAGTVVEWTGSANGAFVDNSANVNITVPTDWHVQNPFLHDPFV